MDFCGLFWSQCSFNVQIVRSGSVCLILLTLVVLECEIFVPAAVICLQMFYAYIHMYVPWYVLFRFYVVSEFWIVFISIVFLTSVHFNWYYLLISGCQIKIKSQFSRWYKYVSFGHFLAPVQMHGSLNLQLIQSSSKPDLKI